MLDKKGATEQKRQKSNNHQFTSSPLAAVSTGTLPPLVAPLTRHSTKELETKNETSGHEKEWQGPESCQSSHNTALHNANSDSLPRDVFLKNPELATDKKTLGAFLPRPAGSG